MYKLADSGELRQLAERGHHFVDPSYKFEFARAEEFARPMSAEDIYQNVVGHINPNYGRPGTTNNCRRCTFAYELSRRGYAVEATKSIRGTGQNSFGLYDASHRDRIGGLLSALTKLGDPRIEKIMRSPMGESPIKLRSGVLDNLGRKGSSVSLDIFKALSQNPNGARGELTIKFDNATQHSVAWEIVKGKAIIYDCQTNTMFDTVEKFTAYADYISNAAFTRLDNIELNTNFLIRWCKNIW